MMDFFDLILKGSWIFVGIMCFLFLFLLGVITMPLWIIPYLIYKAVKQNDR